MVVEWQLKYIDFKFVNDRLKNIQEELKQLKRSSSTNQITSHDRTHRRRRSIGASLYRFAVDRVLATSSSSNTSENDSTTSQGHHPFDHDIQELIHDFKYLLYKELNKINSFYTQQENAMIIEHDRLLEQIEKINEILVNFNALIYLCTRLEEIVGRKVKWSFYEMNEMIHPSTNDHHSAEIRNDHETTTTTTTTHSTIGMTSQINSQFNQSLNEEDDFKLSTNKFIKSQYFKDSKIVEHHIRDTVEYYAEYFFEKDTKAAIAALGKMRGGILGSASGGYGGSYGGTFFHSSSKDVFYSGILLGTLFILIGVNIFYYFHTYEFAPNLSSIDYSDQSFSLYRLILFPVMLAFLIAVNIRIWSSHSINYIFILGLNPLMSLQTFRFLTITY
ncbi:hypothetical protein C9374_008915 [Naegleria lovaniensis]|uniref:SPX domain-containing protein n=1 Tax=Naegleria lovaniensis TaxID=51637 RepID=A0AA88KFI4_NAELO|nr:uncharacterized protein C9374_008915 [Naegleria lovaniensis]KAG2377830.1 hypothetical protein C9374_008915 [Naegleria lovaniensis]